MTLYALVITDENTEECCRLLDLKKIPDRLLKNNYWIVWRNKGSARAIPHVVFRERYTIIGHQDEKILVERI